MRQNIPLIAKKVLGGAWRGFNATGRFFLHFFAFIAGLIFLSAIFSGEDPVVEDGSVLVLAPKGSIVDQLEKADPRDILRNGGASPKQTLLQDVLDALEAAKEDDRISALLIEPKFFAGAGLSKLQAIGKAITDFKSSGKKVIAYGDSFNENQYYLAAFADEIYLSHIGGIGIDGFGRFRVYMKGLIDKLGVNYHIFRVGTFKSAVEPYLRNDMSPASEEANLAFLQSLWTSYKADIAEQRKFEPAKIDDYADNLFANLRAADGDEAKMALNQGLVDAVKTRIEFKQYMMDSFTKNEKEDNFVKIDVQKYLKIANVKGRKNQGNEDKIAVVIARGSIVDGSAEPGTIGGDSTARLLEKARFDENVKAVVLRVDSPGGSANASEVIRQQVLALKAAGKPVVVSMGSVAASGGYWISTSADKIFASPTTITGSIGVFAMIPTLEKPLNEIFALNRDGVATNKLTNGVDIYNGIQPEMAEIIQYSVENIYDKFLTIVSEGRNMSKEAVDKVAQGRVWAGSTALELGLVDQLGNLPEAIKAAAELAKITEYDVKTIEKDLSFGQRLLQHMGEASLSVLAKTETASAPVGGLQQVLDDLQGEYRALQQFNDPKHIYAHCLCELK